MATGGDRRMADEVLDLRRAMERFAAGRPGVDLDEGHLRQRHRALPHIQAAAAGSSRARIEWLPSKTLLDVARAPEAQLISIAPPITDLLAEAADAIPRPQVDDMRDTGLPILGLVRFEEPILPQQGNAKLHFEGHTVYAAPVPVLAVAWRLWPAAIEYIAITREEDKRKVMASAEHELSELVGHDLTGKYVRPRNGTGIDTDGMGSLSVLTPGPDDGLASKDDTFSGGRIDMTVGEMWAVPRGVVEVGA
jgi:hypothetical protein